MLIPLPKQFKDDAELIAALNAGHTVYVGTFDATTREERVLLVVDGKPILNGGDAVKALPPGVDWLYMIIPLSGDSYDRGNFQCHVYQSVHEYKEEIGLIPRGW